MHFIKVAIASIATSTVALALPNPFPVPHNASVIAGRYANNTARTIPPNYLYAVTEYPKGCGGGGGQLFYGMDVNLGACSAIGGLESPVLFKSAKFEAPENYHLKLFAGSDCQQQIFQQDAGISTCFNVPNGATVAAFIVYQ